MNPQILKNKNIVISASAEGIGLTIAEECLKNGAKVFLTDKNEESINKMQEIGRTEVNKHGIYVRFVCTPVNTI